MRTKRAKRGSEQGAREIAERERADYRLERANRARRVLAECSHVLVHASDETGMLESMCRLLVNSGGYRMAWVGLATGDPVRPIRPAAHVGYGSDAPMTGPAGWSANGRYQGFMADVVTTGKPHIARNILDDPAAVQRRARAVQHGFQSSIGLPLKGEGGVLGAIGLYAREPDAFDTDEIDLLTGLADDIAFGITSVRTRVARQEAEARSEQVRAQLAAIVEFSYDAIVSRNLDRKIISWNAAAERLFGYTAAEAIGRDTSLIIPPDREAESAQKQALLEDGSPIPPYDTVRMAKDGRRIDVSVTPSPINDASGNLIGVSVVFRDITERKRAEAERAQLAAIVENSNDAIISRTLEGIITSWNAGAERLLGYSASEAIGRPITFILPPGQQSRLSQATERVLRGEVVAPHESQRVTKDGRLVDVLISISPIKDGTGEVVGASVIFHDISALKQAEAALQESEEQFRQLASNIPQVFWICDASQHEMIYVSPAYERITGRPIEPLKTNAHGWLEVVHAEDRERVKAARREAARGRYDEEFRVVRPDGAVRWVRDRAFPVRNADGKVYRIAGIAEDITEHREAEERLLYLAHYDNLTSLPNRVLFYDRLKQALSQARRNHWTMAVMFLDLDRFKNVNDTLGHGAGDLLLRVVSERLAGCVRSGDTVGRLSGDEFAIVLSNLSGPDDARLVAQKIMATFGQSFNLYGKEVYVSASIGITLFPTDSVDQDILIRNADTAMYRAKELGRNGCQFYMPEMNARALERLSLESSLRRALERREFLLHFQPRASLSSGEITGVEALLRWRHPKLGLMAPSDFMPMLEETGLVMPAGEWVIRTACAQIRAWQEAGVKPVPIAVNLSARQFQAKDLGEVIARILNEEGVAHDLLELEITESSLGHNTEEAAETLAFLNSLGVRLAIDDFGTGYSSLSRLKRFPLDALKIDRSFVRDVTTDADDSAITRAIITMAHSLELAVVAEGVETKQQLDFLAANGCDEIQGHYFSIPLSAEECTMFLLSGRRLERPMPSVLVEPPAVRLNLAHPV